MILRKHKAPGRAFGLLRHMESFPIGKDEDILAIDPPYYTACPNPYFNDFIERYTNPTTRKDDYHRIPLSVIHEGKMTLSITPIYHTKVPHAGPVILS